MRYLVFAIMCCHSIVIGQGLHIVGRLDSLYQSEEYEAVISMVNELTSNKTFEEGHDLEVKAQITSLLAKSYYNINREDFAVRHFKEAVALYKNHNQAKNLGEVANIYFNIAASYQYLGLSHQGEKYIDSCFTILANLPSYPKDLLFFKYQGAGSLYSELRDFEKAESFYKAAETLKQEITEIDAFYLDIEVLSFYLKHRKFNRARQIINQISEIYDLLSDDFTSYERTLYHLNLAEYYTKSKNYDAAKKQITDAFTNIDTSDYFLLANAYEISGVIHYETKKYKESFQDYRKAYLLRKNTDITLSNLSQSFSLENLAELMLEEGNNDSTALENINSAMALTAPEVAMDINQNPILADQQIENGFHLIRQLVLKYDILKTEKTQLRQRSQVISKIDTLLQTTLQNALIDQSKLNLLTEINLPYDEFVSHYTKVYKQSNNKKDLLAALHQVSQSKGTLLIDYIKTQALLSDLRNTPLYEQYQSTNEALSIIRKRKISDTALPEDAAQNAKLQLQLEKEKSALNNAIFDKSQRKDFDKSLNDIQKSLNKNTIIVDLFEGQDFLYLFLISKNDVVLRQVPVATYSQQLDDILEAVKNPTEPFNTSIANELYRKLYFDQIMPTKVINNIIISPHGRWNKLPFEILVDNEGEYLVLSTAISYLYNVEALSQKRERYDFTEDFVGFGTTYTDQLNSKLRQLPEQTDLWQLGRLLQSEEEMERCSAPFSHKIFKGPETSLRNFKKFAPLGRYLYLSLHSVSDIEEGSNGFLVFDDRNEDFLLRSFELVKRNYCADLVVLSACHTADGTMVAGEGLNGITRAFLSNNIGGLVSSLWQATEQSSGDILSVMFDNINRKEPSAFALQKAKISYLETASPTLRHPYYWANYILFTKSVPSNQNCYQHAWVLILSLTIVGYLIWYYLRNRP